MKKIIGIILLVVGGYLFLRGHDVSQSAAGQLQDVANRISGRADGKAVQYYIGGAISCAVGVVMLFFLPSKK